MFVYTLPQTCALSSVRFLQVTSAATEQVALGRDVDAAWARAQQSQARVAEATKALRTA